MFYVLQYPNFTTQQLAQDMCNTDGCIEKNQVFNWLMYGKLPESIVLEPTYYMQYQQANGKNHYLSDVTVMPMKPFTANITLAVGAALTLTIPQEGPATENTNPAIATANFASGVLTITAVAAGNTVITVEDKFNNTIGTVNVTVA